MVSRKGAKGPRENESFGAVEVFSSVMLNGVKHLLCAFSIFSTRTEKSKADSSSLGSSE
jgi:hypothetical protein